MRTSVIRPEKQRSTYRSHTRAAVAAMLLGSAAWAAGDTAELFQVTHHTAMPHLEENLRYATTTGQHCMRSTDYSILFPVLGNASLDGCRLQYQRRQDDSTYHVLRCDNPDTATGTARLTPYPARIRGTLEVKMGGKNMTFVQTVEAVRRGPCQPRPGTSPP